MFSVDTILEKLQDRGFRLTNQRQLIASVLSFSPQSADEVFMKLNKNKANIDKVTIYRTLDCFCELGLVAKTRFKDSEAKYELVDKTNHHHHLVCDNCGKVEDINLDERSLVEKVGKKTDFLIKSHSLEFFGICAKCQKI